MLVVGGTNRNGNILTAERFDPRNGQFGATGSPGGTQGARTAAIRVGHTATHLTDGRVLIAGGRGWYFDPGAANDPTAVLYDPSLGTFSPTGRLVVAGRQQHAATLLADGRVLLVGGRDPSGILDSAELYEPRTGEFSATGKLTVRRGSLLNGGISVTATLLLDGRVLVTGPTNIFGPDATAELYDPRTGAFSGTGKMALARAYPSATRLGDGRVLFAGGFDGNGDAIAAAELYDPQTGSFIPTGSLKAARVYQTATLLTDGRVLIVGGQARREGGARVAELYDPGTGSFSTTASLAADRYHHTASRLTDGRVLVAGGQLDGATAEIFQ